MLILLLQLPAYLYRWLFSPLLHALCGPGCGCRFAPSCSEYWIESLKKHGPLQGLRFSLNRLARCHPWNRGGYDPVPRPKPQSNEWRVASILDRSNIDFLKLILQQNSFKKIYFHLILPQNSLPTTRHSLLYLINLHLLNLLNT